MHSRPWGPRDDVGVAGICRRRAGGCRRQCECGRARARGGCADGEALRLTGADKRGGRLRDGAAPEDLVRVPRPDAHQGKPLRLGRGRQIARRGPRPPAFLRASGLGQDHACRRGSQRDGRLLQGHERACHRACRRSGRHTHQPRGRRRPLHRRDSPPEPRRGRGALSGDGGFRPRHRHRPRAGRPLYTPRSAAFHARGRHHAHRPAHRPSTRPLRRVFSPRLLHRPRALRHRRPLGLHPWRRDRLLWCRRDCLALACHAPPSEPPAQTGARLCAGPRRRPHRPADGRPCALVF